MLHEEDKEGENEGLNEKKKTRKLLLRDIILKKLRNARRRKKIKNKRSVYAVLYVYDFVEEKKQEKSRANKMKMIIVRSSPSRGKKTAFSM